jgi:hypothetical protein
MMRLPLERNVGPKNATPRREISYARRARVGCTPDHPGAGCFMQRLLLVSADFVIGDADTLSHAAILLIKPHHRVGCCAGAREEVEDNCALLFRGKYTQHVFNKVKRFWERKFPSRNELSEKRRL